MHRIIIIDENGNLNTKKRKKTIKINDNLLEIGLRKGLIEKDRDDFFFLGDYENFLVFKNKKND